MGAMRGWGRQESSAFNRALQFAAHSAWRVRRLGSRKRGDGRMRSLVRLVAAALFALGWATGAVAQERTAIRQGFELPANSGKRILVFRPKVSIGAQSTGGMFEPNAEWTDQARRNIEAALRTRQAGLGNTVVIAPEAYGEQAQLVEEYTNLFDAVSQAVVTYQFFVGNRLATKKRDNKAGVFDWSLGEGVRDLPGAADADYALFFYNKDEFGSTGRKLLQAVALLGGVGVTSGVHKGAAGLVDLKTGDLLWLNADFAMGGDPREADGATKRVSQLLEEFPGSVVKPAAATPTVAKP